MEIAIKLGDARLPTHDAYEKNWLNGQPIEARWDGFKWGKMDKSSFLIIRTLDDFWQVRGGTDWKVWNKQTEEFKKLFSAKDSIGKYLWEFGFLKEEKRIRMRDRFLDITALLKDETISRDYYDNLYNHDVEAGILNLNISLFDILKHEGIDQREVMIKNQGITSGVYKIGTGGGANYATWALFATDVNAGEQMDGNLTGEGQNEETAISSPIVFDTDTNGNLLKITAESGAEHNGGAYGNGARVIFGTYDIIELDETTDDDLANVEFSKLAFDISGDGNKGILINDAGGDDEIIIQRMLIKGDSSSEQGIFEDESQTTNLSIINNIVYGIGAQSGEGGIVFDTTWGAGICNILNNTVIGCYDNIIQDSVANNESPTLVVKNNLCQADSGGSDYRDDGDGFGTTGHNVSEDATSPDAAYQSKDVHTNSVFKDYAADDYRLDSAGDSINLAILDDGEDLSGTFEDDIEGQTRSTWYIGASEIVAAGGIEIFRRRIEGY